MYWKDKKRIRNLKLDFLFKIEQLQQQKNINILLGFTVSQFLHKLHNLVKLLVINILSKVDKALKK